MVCVGVCRGVFVCTGVWVLSVYRGVFGVGVMEVCACSCACV